MQQYRRVPRAVRRGRRGPPTSQEVGDEPTAQRAALLLADVLLREGRIADGGRAAHEVCEWTEKYNNPYILARNHRVLSLFSRLIGDLSDSLAHAVQCLEHLPEDAPPGIRARHVMALAVALDDNGSMSEGERHYHEVLRLAAETDEPGLMLRVLNNMTFNAYECGDEPAAHALADRMREVATTACRRLAAKELDTIARVEMMSGRYDTIEVILAGALDGGFTEVDGDGTAECLLTLTEARRLAGRNPDAQTALDQAAGECDKRGLSRLRAQCRQEQAALYAAAGRYREAYEEHQHFYADESALHSHRREVRARTLQAVFDAGEAHRASEHFRELAHRDALTGLYNRRYVDEQLPALLRQAEAGRRPLSVAIADLDHFKRINDTLSHAAGDEVLRCIGELLREATADPAIVARLGGEEFLLISLPGRGRGRGRLRTAPAADPCVSVATGNRRHPGDRQYRRDNCSGRTGDRVKHSGACRPPPLRRQARRPRPGDRRPTLTGPPRIGWRPIAKPSALRSSAAMHTRPVAAGAGSRCRRPRRRRRSRSGSRHPPIAAGPFELFLMRLTRRNELLQRPVRRGIGWRKGLS